MRGVGSDGSQHAGQPISRAKRAEFFGILNAAPQGQTRRIGEAARGAAQPGNEIGFGRDAGFLGLGFARVNHGLKRAGIQRAGDDRGM